MIRKAKRELYRDGAVYTWITYNIHGDSHGDNKSVMDDARALNLLSLIRNGSYFIRIKYITVDRTTDNNRVYVIRDNLNPVYKDKKKNGYLR